MVVAGSILYGIARVWEVVGRALSSSQIFHDMAVEALEGPSVKSHLRRGAHSMDLSPASIHR